MFSILKIIILGLIFSSAAWADDDWNRHRHGHHHGHHHREHYPYYRRDIVYLPAPPVVEYVPVAPRYYAPPPVSYYRYDQRSPTGLVGSMVGGAVGYQVGGGDPLAAGIGAAAGAIIGNGRY
jgi:hypothetical protein